MRKDILENANTYTLSDFQKLKLAESYKKLSAARDNASQIKAYNAVIGMCINCHESYCSGPLKRIRKLPI